MVTYYTVRKSVAHVGTWEVDRCDTWKEAVAAARKAGAKGRPEGRGHGEWCFDGGKQSIGFWIAKEPS